MKKFLALALALALGISLAATAFAEGLNLLGEAASLPEEAAAPAQARLEEAPAPETLPAADSFEEHKGAAGWIDVSSAQEWSAALDGIGTAGSTTCQIRLTDSFALPDTLTIAQGNTLELDLNGQTLTAAQGKRHLAVSGSLTLTDSGSGGALYGGDPAGNPGGGIEVWQDGMFTMKGGAITDCTAQSSGGVDAKGTFAMKGDAAITGCTAETGGGVYMNIGAFSMADSAAITGCTATEEAGGVWISGARSDSITVSGAPRMAGNKAGTNKADSNLCLYSEAGAPGSSSDKFPQVTVQGTLGQGASLGLTLDGDATWGGPDDHKDRPGRGSRRGGPAKIFPGQRPGQQPDQRNADAGGRPAHGGAGGKRCAGQNGPEPYGGADGDADGHRLPSACGGQNRHLEKRK